MVIYIALALVIIVAALIYARSHRNDIKAMSIGLTAGVSLAVSALTVPYYALSYTDPFMIGIKCFRYGASAVSLNVDPAIVGALELQEPTQTIYKALLYTLYFAGPICASMFVVSFSRTVTEWFHFLGNRKVHVFSELNSRTAAIAESLAETHPREMLLFCNSEEAASDDLSMRARAAHAIFTGKNEAEIPVRRRKEYEFYEIGSDVRKVLADTTNLCSELVRRKSYDQSSVFVRFSASDTYPDMIRDLDRTYGSRVRLRPVDENQSEARSVLRNYCSELSVPGDHEAVIIGGGDAGLAILKDALCIMTGPESRASVRYISVGAASDASRFKASAPEIMEKPLSCYIGAGSEGGDYDIRFYSEDPDGSVLFDILASERTPDLVCITGEDDEQNFSLSQKVKRFYASRSEDLSYPPIACRVRDKKLNEILGDDDGVLLFGNEAHRYRYENLIDPELEEEARRVHLSYLLPSRPDALDITGREREKLLEDTGFYSYVNMQSSMANALSLEYRRAYILTKKPEGDSRTDGEFVADWLNDPGNLSMLGDAEHIRWNAYQRLQGWRRADEAQTGAIAESTGGRRIRSDEFMLHPALVTVEDLPGTEETTDAIKRAVDPSCSGTGFVESDRVILRNLPRILRKD